MSNSTYISEEDIALYANLLRELKARMDAAWQVAHTARQTHPNADLIAAELRIVLELILLGGLITNRAEISNVTTAFHRHDADKAKKVVERVNPGYWPKPTKQIDDGPGRFRLEDVAEGFLTRDGWGPAYGYLSDRLHASNPYRSAPFGSEPLEPVYQRLGEIHAEIVTLTNHHWIEPANPDYRLVGLMQGTDDGDVQVTLFRRLEGSPTSVEAVEPGDGPSSGR